MFSLVAVFQAVDLLALWTVRVLVSLPLVRAMPSAVGAKFVAFVTQSSVHFNLRMELHDISDYIVTAG